MSEEILWPPQDKNQEPPEEKPAKKPEASKQPKIETTPVDPAFANAPMVSLSEAARQTNKSRGTIRNWLVEGKVPGARRTETGWQIPVPSLVATGLWDRTSPPDEVKEPPEHDRLSELESELARARMELHSEKKLREAAERNAEDLRVAMRMLNAGPQRPIGKENVNQQVRPTQDRWELTPATVVDAVQKFRRKLLG